MFEEADVAEVMAVSWKEKRQELNKLQKSRRFKAATDLRRSFRVEVEELKKRTKCHRCHRVGHWSRECPQRAQSAKPSSSSSGSQQPKRSPEMGAAMVVHSVDNNYKWFRDGFFAVGTHETSCTTSVGTTHLRAVAGFLTGIRSFGLWVRPHHYRQSNTVGFSANVERSKHDASQKVR